MEHVFLYFNEDGPLYKGTKENFIIRGPPFWTDELPGMMAHVFSYGGRKIGSGSKSNLYGEG